MQASNRRRRLPRRVRRSNKSVAQQKKQQQKKFRVSAFGLGVLVGAFFFGMFSSLAVWAFNGPGNNSAGNGSGAIGVNASNNVSIGTSSPVGDTKFDIVGSTTDSSAYTLKILQPNAGVIFYIRDDGAVFASGTVTCGTGCLGTVTAGNVTPGVFNGSQSTSSGNFAFPAAVGINTSTQVGLPATLSVFGNIFATGTISASSDLSGANLFSAPNLTDIFVGDYSTGCGPACSSSGTITLQGSNNTAIGYNALGMTSSTDNVAVGSQALDARFTGYGNVAVGSQALTNYIGSFGIGIANARNVAVGFQALASNVRQGGLTAIGGEALASSVVGTFDTAVGFNALSSLTGGINDTAVGNAALLNALGSQNTAIGAYSQASSTNGTNNTSIGWGALASNISGSNNNAFGSAAMQSSTGGNNNEAFGDLTLNSLTTGSNNIMVGDSAGTNVAGGNGNVGIGSLALGTLANGNYNTAVGYNAGFASAGSGNVFLGNNAGYLANASNTLYIANAAGTPLIYGDFAGNRVGINTTTPSQAFSVQGNIYASGNITCGGACSGGGGVSGGQTNYIPLWTGASSLGTSTLQQNGTTTYTTQGFAVGTSTAQSAGNVYITGNYLGGTVAASQISAGAFGSGNFAVPSGLAIGTSTTVLPAPTSYDALSVMGTTGQTNVVFGNPNGPNTFDTLALNIAGSGYNYQSSNCYFDGANWNERNTSNECWIYAMISTTGSGGSWDIYRAAPASNPITVGNPLITLTSGGRFGIATSTPGTALDVNGDITDEGVRSSLLKTDANGKMVGASSGGVDYVKSLTITTTTINYDHVVNSTTTVTMAGPSSAATATAYSYSVAGNTLGTTKALRVTVSGNYLDNQLGADTESVYLVYGNQVVAKATFTPAQSPSLGYWTAQLTLANVSGTTNTQIGSAIIYGNTGLGAAFQSGGAGTASIDSTAAQTLQVWIGNSANNANVSIVASMIETELLNDTTTVVTGVVQN